ncbi:hypothetical protein K457DRAFT_28370 [Linnemannia elongata AG-77]|uniref:Uncharacterized protein n=1 Tax=Linnemannia elongata AG-77 TaxID=1314771 RepID=A0A197KAD2_9FUNG|nr:hypothetical protein K457DRAFT_28370 [Linnemannia elongata AG-77]
MSSAIRTHPYSVVSVALQRITNPSWLIVPSSSLTLHKPTNLFTIMDTNASSMAFFKNMKCNSAPSSSSPRPSSRLFSFKSSKPSRVSQVGTYNPSHEKIMSSNNSSASTLPRH